MMNLKTVLKDLRSVRFEIRELKDREKVLTDKRDSIIAASYDLEKGDKLLITEECHQHIMGRKWWDNDGSAVGDLAEFSYLSADDGTCSINSITAWWSSGAFPVDMVQRMKAAYNRTIDIVAEQERE